MLSSDSYVGGDRFLRETFNGNGRSCATCHAVARNFTIDPAFIATLPANDPLFVAETPRSTSHSPTSGSRREARCSRAKLDNITTLFATAANGFGSNLNYQIGDGPLMF